MKKTKPHKKYTKSGSTLNLIITLAVILFSLISCETKHKKKIYCPQSEPSKAVIYSVRNAKIFFSYFDVINYCDNMTELGSNNKLPKVLKQYLENNLTGAIIYDTLVKVKEFVKINHKGILTDSVMEVPDWGYLQNQLAEAMKWCAIELINKKAINVFDKNTNQLVPYFYYETVTSNLGKEMICYLPNDSIFLSGLLWIK